MRLPWCVQPDVHAAAESLRKSDVVLLNVDDAHRIAQGAPGGEDAAYQLLATLVPGVRFAAVDDLQRPCTGGYPAQPVEVGKEEVGALVGCCPAGEADGQNCRIELHAGSALHLVEQVAFCRDVGIANLVQGDAHCVTQVPAVVAPFRYVTVKEAAEGRGSPGHRMDPVGDGVDGVTREHVL